MMRMPRASRAAISPASSALRDRKLRNVDDDRARPRRSRASGGGGIDLGEPILERRRGREHQGHEGAAAETDRLAGADGTVTGTVPGGRPRCRHVMVNRRLRSAPASRFVFTSGRSAPLASKGVDTAFARRMNFASRAEDLASSAPALAIRGRAVAAALRMKADKPLRFDVDALRKAWGEKTFARARPISGTARCRFSPLSRGACWRRFRERRTIAPRSPAAAGRSGANAPASPSDSGASASTWSRRPWRPMR